MTTFAPSPQKELPLFKVEREDPNVDWFVKVLEGKDWMTASEVLAQIGQEGTENNKRKVRAWANASGGRVCGHQKGYKLEKAMTGEEYGWWRNEMLKASEAVRARVVESDRLHYSRKS